MSDQVRGSFKVSVQWICLTWHFLFKELQAKAEQISEMAAVMTKAISIDDTAIQAEEERLAELEMENKGLRELLKISGLSDQDLENYKKEHSMWQVT